MVSSPSQKSWQLCILFQGVRKLVAASCHVCCLLLYSEVGQALFMHENTVRLRDWLYIHWPSHTGLWDWAALTLKSPDAQFGGFGLGTSLLTGLQTGFRLNPAWQLSSTCSKRPMGTVGIFQTVVLADLPASPGINSQRDLTCFWSLGHLRRLPWKGCFLSSFPFSQRAWKTPGCPASCVTLSLGEL